MCNIVCVCVRVKYLEVIDMMFESVQGLGSIFLGLIFGGAVLCICVALRTLAFGIDETDTITHCNALQHTATHCNTL